MAKGRPRKTDKAAADEGPRAPYGHVPHFARCLPPFHVTASLAPAVDPLQRLGLDPARRATEDEVRAAFERELRQHPPEREPDAARELIEARDRLLRPERVLERELGVLYVPDPVASGLPAVEPTSARAERGPLVASYPRLLAMLALYTLLEDELER